MRRPDFKAKITASPAAVSNALTIDVEDYFHGETLQPYVPSSSWSDFEPRVGANVEKLLQLLNAAGTKSTFFVLGWVAERNPDLVEKLHNAGHEIACHGHAHQMIHRQKPDEFREDVRRAKATLEGIIGEKVVGYRAPTFSVMKETLWALDILAEEGFLYDSSIFPIRHDRYGIPDWNRHIQRVELRNNMTIVEAPPATAHIFGMNFPAAGGGYFRLGPVSFFSWAIRRLNASGHPAVLYFHPWEFDPDQPRFPLPPLSRFRNYVNLATTENKLRRLLSSASFTSLRNILSI